MNDKISLIDLARALREHDVEVSYPQCWRAVVDGRIPATREQRRWWVKSADLPMIAATISKATA